MEGNYHLGINDDSITFIYKFPHMVLTIPCYYHFIIPILEMKKWNRNEPNCQSYEVIEPRSKPRFGSKASFSLIPALSKLQSFTCHLHSSYPIHVTALLFFIEVFLKLSPKNKFSFNLAINSKSWFFFSKRH